MSGDPRPNPGRGRSIFQGAPELWRSQPYYHTRFVVIGCPPALGAAVLHTGTSDPTVEVMGGGLGASALPGWEDSTLIYRGQRAEVEIQNGQVFLQPVRATLAHTDEGEADTYVFRYDRR